MWIFRWILAALVIIVVLGFALQNQDQTVSVRVITYQSPVLPLYTFLYIAFGIGFLFWLAIFLFNSIKLKSEIATLQRENKKVRKELNRMRNVNIDDEAEATELAEDASSVH